MLMSAIAGEHMVLIGPPGTAKSALIEAFARGIDATYFEYLLTRFTEPSELLGPVDLIAFREGRYARRMDGMLPSAEIVFLDELFKANSAILNSLLHIVNERKVHQGGERMPVPLLCLFAASNEVPRDESLTAVYDRFLLRVVSDNVESYQFGHLLERGRALEANRLAGTQPEPPCLHAATLRQVHRAMPDLLRLPDAFIETYKALVMQLRSEGVALSDRRAVKLQKLFVASALVDGRTEVHLGDLFVLRHIWNTPEQIPLVQELIDPVVNAYWQEHPEAATKRAGASPESMAQEVAAIAGRLAARAALSDAQLFSELRQLSELKSRLATFPGEAPRRMVQEIDQILESVFADSPLGRG